jgi:hypothetical protein
MSAAKRFAPDSGSSLTIATPALRSHAFSLLLTEFGQHLGQQAPSTASTRIPAQERHPLSIDVEAARVPRTG